MNRLYVIGIGPGSYQGMTLEAKAALEQCQVIIGYTLYTELIKTYFPDKELLTTPMTKEAERCILAFEQAVSGKVTAMICSGDAGVYGMSGLMYEIGVRYPDVALEIIPGVTAANAGAAVLGASLMHDFAVISLSDLLTPWEKIAARLQHAAKADFVICLYNPGSRKRKDYLSRACQLIAEDIPPERICAVARNIGREGEEGWILSFAELAVMEADMFMTIYIGNSETKVINGKMVTPRGYVNV